MKYIFTLVLGFLLAGSASAQVVQVNPNVGWKFVRSQKLNLQPENEYQYEFPAETGNDYIFNLFFDKPDIITYVKIFDIQMKPIAEMTDRNGVKTSKLEFVVPASGTYIVSVGYMEKVKSSDPTTAIELTLIERPFVE